MQRGLGGFLPKSLCVLSVLCGEIRFRYDAGPQTRMRPSASATAMWSPSP